MCDETVANFFYNTLKERGKIHYSELLERLQCSDCEEKTFFDSYTDYGRRWFFKVHSSLFRINDDGYVSLIDGMKELASQTRQSSQKENGEAESLASEGEQPAARFVCSNASSVEAVIEGLVSTLSEHGSVHYLDLTKHQFKGTKTNVSQYFETLSPLEKFLFFKNRFDVFNIDDQGYVTVKTSAPGDLEEGTQTDIEKVLDFFTSVLRITRKMNHRKLVGYLQDSNLDVKDYFDFYSNNELRRFFKEQASRFQLEFYSSVYLQVEKNDSVAPEEGKEWKNTQAEERNRTANSDDSVRFSRLPKIENENLIVKCFISTLKEYGPMHHNALVLCANQKAKYFKQLSAFERLCFFNKWSNTFSILDDGYVLLNDEIERTVQEEKAIEDQVIEFFVSILRSKQRMLRYDLGKLLENSELAAKNYFGKTTDRKLEKFFKKHSSVFRKEKCSYISLWENTAELSEGNETFANAYEAKDVQNTRTKGRNDLRFTLESKSTFEETVIETLVAALLEYGPMHHLALLKCAYEFRRKNKKYFDKSYIDGTFFRNNQDIFRIENNGHVALTELALNRVNPKETEILDYLTSLLKKSSSLPPHALVSRIRKSGLTTRDYFDSFTFKDILEFFENHPSRFVLRHEINVSLSVEAMKSSKQDGGSNHAKRFDEVETLRIKGNSGIDSCLLPPMASREHCEKEENNVFRTTDETKNLLLSDVNVNCQAKKVSDWIFGCEKDHKSSSNRLEENAVYGCCSNLPTKSAAACSFKTSDSKYDSKLDSFTFCKEGKGQDRNVSKIETSKSFANDCKENSAKTGAFSGSTTLESNARSGLLCTLSASDYSYPREARPISKCESMVSTSDQKLDSTGMVHLNDMLCLADSHIQSIRYFVIVLKDRNIKHYHQLLYKACSYDRYMFSFFSKFTLADVLEFIRMHSMYFSIQCDGNVTLLDPTIAPSKILTSEDHVLQVTSVVDAKAVEFFGNLLRQRKKMALIELKFYLGFAPGYVLSFIVANFHGGDFVKFFQRHPSYFHICENEYVELSLKLLDEKSV